MKRRNFLKVLSSIPLIGIPAKLLAKPEAFEPNRHVGTKTWFDGEKVRQTRITREEWMNPTGDPVPDNAVSLAEPRKVWNMKNGSTLTWLG